MKATTTNLFSGTNYNTSYSTSLGLLFITQSCSQQLADRKSHRQFGCQTEQRTETDDGYSRSWAWLLDVWSYKRRWICPAPIIDPNCWKPSDHLGATLGCPTTSVGRSTRWIGG